MSDLTETELVKEFLLERTNFSDNIALSSFKRYFPKNTSDIVIKEIYNHLKRLDHKKRRKLEKEIDQDESLLTSNKFDSKNVKKDQDFNKVIKNLDTFSAIIDSELEALTQKRDEELRKFQSFINEISNDQLEEEADEENEKLLKETIDDLNYLQKDLKNISSID